METRDMLWSGWGDPAKAAPLPGPVVGLLRDLLGVRPAAEPAAALTGVRVAEPRLSGDDLTVLAAVVGDGNVRADTEARLRHTRGKSTPDLLRIRAGDAADAPDAVVLPGDHGEVLAVLDACAERRIAVVPFGGGTSVVGGLAPEGADRFVALDLRRMDRLVELDEVSRTAVLQPGLRAPAAEALLNERGYTLGHFPQSYEWASIGGFAAARSSGQASAGYGRFDDMVVGLTAATPEGTLDLGRAPKSAAGPDLRQLVLGSEGALGVITSVRVRVHPVPEAREYEGWRFASFDQGAAALRRLAQDGPLPAVLRLSDETETMVGLADPAAIGEDSSSAGALAVLGFEGAPALVADRRARAAQALREAGGEPLGAGPGEKWEHGRFNAPYLRDSLLDAGAFVETLETAAFWSDVPALYEAVRQALIATLSGAGTPPLVMCHISHVYPTGASLYFTVVSAQGEEPLGHWAAAKRAACDAILARGGTISHHHGVGTDHRDWYAREIGPLGAAVLRAVKDRVDPAGILNPGVLVPPAGRE
ncbi:alkyldihydroxyacetonephosphate synthase [Actinomadura coerulea]|uniref:Alkyldihydroxyacetonephosphate synthase n=2 Tax=Actinomadura coerulea TaxID=46159 RepID=A0A7X0FYN2_9ACTN|nr:alkyldihydroxyacetonephosphate synthase [Actinomadura coerulea]GGQ38650.1 alkyldihydroxyacetonephosphate synthase [Actinomadura coerulea]